jgi:two-component system response regulator AtoC
MSRILVVDDEKQIRRILSVLLAEHGHDVREADSGEAALALQPEFQPNIVLLDLSLPGINGLETLQKLLEWNRRIDCIMMTAYGTIRSAVQAMRLGAFDYLSKPFDNDELLLIIDRALHMRRLDAELEDLRSELEARYGFNEIVGISPQMREVFRIMAKVAAVDATVLITGESGTGKELVARAIHRRSRRAGGTFLAINCSAIPNELLEAEFFGHEKGAYTDAHVSRAGKFELASGGTLFLDEVGDLSLEAQAKLLRVLQEHEVTKIGGKRPTRVDVRVIAATNKDLERAVRRDEFREDLYWRINVVTIKLPPLRDRREDLPLLIDHLLDRFQRELKLSVKSISPEARTLLLNYHWPGNIRELENTLCRALILCDGNVLMRADLPPRIRGELPAESLSASSDLDKLKLSEAVAEATERLEKMLIVSRLAQHKGSRTATAESLGISRKTLFNKMRQYGLSGDEEEPQ